MTQTVSRDHLSHVAHLWLSDATPPPERSAVPAIQVWAVLADYLNADPLETAVALADFWGRQGGRVAIVRVGEQCSSLWRVGSDQSAVANRNVIFAPEALECRKAIRRGRPGGDGPLDMPAAIEAAGQWANRIFLVADPDESGRMSQLLATADELLLVIRPDRRDLLEAYRVLKRLAPNMPAARWGGVCLDAESAADGADAMARLRDTAVEHLNINMTDRGFLLRETDAASPQRTRLAEGAGTTDPDTIGWLGKWLGVEPDPAVEAEAEVEPEAASPCSRPPAVVPLLGAEVSSDALLTSVLAELHLVLPGVRSANGGTRPNARPIALLVDSDGRGVLLAASADDPIFLLADLAELLIADGIERRIILIHRNLPARTAALIRCLKFDIELLRATPVRLPTGAGVLLGSS